MIDAAYPCVDGRRAAWLVRADDGGADDGGADDGGAQVVTAASVAVPIAVGTLDAGVLATVGATGAVTPSGGGTIDWWVVAEDRVHRPADEASTRQRLVDDVPVVETSVRVPGGDLVATAYAVAGSRPLVVIELDNRSPAAVAVAFSRPVVADRALHAPPAGAGLPDGSVLVPVGHRASVRVAVLDGGPVTSVLAGLASPARVVRGWQAQAAVGPHLVLPDELAPLLVRARCVALLGRTHAGGGTDDRDDAENLVAAGIALGRGDRIADEAVPELAAAIERLARGHRRAAEMPWLDALALDAAAVVLAGAGEHRAADDVRATIARLPPPGRLPDAAPVEGGPFAVVAWLTAQLVRPVGGGVQLLAGADRSWLGRPVEAHGVPTARGTVGVAVRWHGDRPALLWSCDGAPAPGAPRLTVPALDPSWSTTEPRGDALLAVPPMALMIGG